MQEILKNTEQLQVLGKEIGHGAEKKDKTGSDAE